METLPGSRWTDRKHVASDQMKWQITVMSKFPGQCVCISFSSFLFYSLLSSLSLPLLFSFWPFGPFLKQKRSLIFYERSSSTPYCSSIFHLSLTEVYGKKNQSFEKERQWWIKEERHWMFNTVETSFTRVEWKFRNFKILTIWIFI